MIPRSSHARGDLPGDRSIDYAHTYALDLTAKAKAAIENVELDPHARELFLSMADFFVERLN